MLDTAECALLCRDFWAYGSAKLVKSKSGPHRGGHGGTEYDKFAKTRSRLAASAQQPSQQGGRVAYESLGLATERWNELTCAPRLGVPRRTKGDILCAALSVSIE